MTRMEEKLLMKLVWYKDFLGLALCKYKPDEWRLLPV